MRGCESVCSTPESFSVVLVLGKQTFLTAGEGGLTSGCTGTDILPLKKEKERGYVPGERAEGAVQQYGVKLCYRTCLGT